MGQDYLDIQYKGNLPAFNVTGLDVEGLHELEKVLQMRTRNVDTLYKVGKTPYKDIEALTKSPLPPVK